MMRSSFLATFLAPHLLVAAIHRLGGQAVGMSGEDGPSIIAEPLSEGMGFVGRVTQINREPITALLGRGYIPVIASIGLGYDGHAYNINADTVAGAVAAAVNAKRFLLLTDVPGVLDADKRLIPELTAAEARRLIADGTISGGMIPKVETCLDAIDGGAEGAVILDGRVAHAILLELFTEGAGTLIRHG